MPRLLAQLEGALRAGPPLRLALLFGSVARGTQRADSDVDVAILPAAPELSLPAFHLKQDSYKYFVARKSKFQINKLER
jgi:predicted nucleotidyltransferase